MFSKQNPFTYETEVNLFTHVSGKHSKVVYVSNEIPTTQVAHPFSQWSLCNTGNALVRNYPIPHILVVYFRSKLEGISEKRIKYRAVAYLLGCSTLHPMVPGSSTAVGRFFQTENWLMRYFIHFIYHKCINVYVYCYIPFLSLLFFSFPLLLFLIILIDQICVSEFSKRLGRLQKHFHI